MYYCYARLRVGIDTQCSLMSVAQMREEKGPTITSNARLVEHYCSRLGNDKEHRNPMRRKPLDTHETFENIP